VELQKSKGLDVVKDASFDLKDYDSSELKTYEVVISPSSPLVNQTVRESNFRGAYDAVILAFHRSGERINSKIGSIRFRVGDTLLILAGKDFRSKWYHSRDFSLVSASEEVLSKKKSQGALAIGIGLAMVTLVTGEVLPMVVASGAAALALIITRCLSLQEAFEGVEWGVLLTIASSLGIARALENAGVAQMVAGAVVAVSASYGPLIVLAAIYVATVILTEVITNNAAAAIMFPIALSVAAQLNQEHIPYVYVTAIGASAAFATPIGYQTNLMVQGPGGYRFMDYVRIGLPLHAIVGTTAVGMIYFLFF
jgi:di/tricarboxylate transporter